MNLVGKILTGIIAFACIVFMALVVAVYATHNNWKAQAQKLSGDLKTARDDVQKKTDELKKLGDDYAVEKKDMRDQLTNLKTEADLVKKSRDDLQAKCDQLATDIRKATETVEATQQTASALRTEVEGLRTKISEVRVQYDKKFAEVVEKTDLLHARANEIAALNQQKTVLAQDLAKAGQVLKKFGLVPEPSRYDGMPPSPLYGKVLANPGNGLIEISLGSDDGLAKGHRLEAYRLSANASTYLGRVEVVTVDVDRAVAKIIPEYQKGIIQKGDNVASQHFTGVASK